MTYALDIYLHNAYGNLSGQLEPVFFRNLVATPIRLLVTSQTWNCRDVFSTEPSEKEKWELLPGRLKKVTGREFIECRNNYSNSGGYLPMWDLVLVANEVPKLKR